MKKIILNTISIILSILLITHIFLLCFGVRFFSVKTGSMEPEIHQGSLVYVKTYKSSDAFFNDIEVGTDITYKLNDKDYVTHRIVTINEKENMIQTSGIISNAAIEDISYNQVVGKVIFTIPVVGYIVRICQTWYFWTMFVLVIVIVYISKLLIKELKKK